MKEGTFNHPMTLDVKLPVGPLANHRLARVTEEKQETALVPAEAVAWVQALRKGGERFNVLNSVVREMFWLQPRQPLPVWSFSSRRFGEQSSP